MKELKEKNSIKNSLHPRNKNREAYDLQALIQAVPELKKHIVPNKLGQDSINFSHPQAVKLLNKGLLSHYYGIKYWEFPMDNLCPPIPGRADYIHYAAALLESSYGTEALENIQAIDIGTGASCIYPILGVQEYGWKFTATDIDTASLAAARKIVANNPTLVGRIELRQQNNHRAIFREVMLAGEKYDISLCNPPFHANEEDALKGSQRKVKNLSGVATKKPTLNFSGRSNELVYRGGEIQFFKNMIADSVAFSKDCFWFTSLVSKHAKLDKVLEILNKTLAKEVKVIDMQTANKASRIIAWTFLSRAEQKQWKENRKQNQHQ